MTFNEVFTVESFAWEEDGIGGFLKVSKGILSFWGKKTKSQKESDNKYFFLLKRPNDFQLSGSDYLIKQEEETFFPKKIILEDNLIKIEAYAVTSNFL